MPSPTTVAAPVAGQGVADGRSACSPASRVSATAWAPELIADRLHAAVQSGALLKDEQGLHQLPPAGTGASPWLSVTVPQGPSVHCRFLMDFLFEQAYAKSAVPWGCRACYKVAVAPHTLAQLMALRRLQERGTGVTAKCGIEVDREITQNLYSGFYYCDGLEQARAVYRRVRDAVDADPALGPDVPMRIKRGCTEYEIHCGPSDRWAFDPAQAEVEASLKTQFKPPPPSTQPALKAKLSTLGRWLQTAFRIGDDSYLQFTGGRRLYPAPVSYDPVPPQEMADSSQLAPGPAHR